MHPDLQRRVQRYGWDKAAAYYDDLWEQQLRPAQEKLLELVGLQPGERVLDLACGSGLVTFPAARAVGEGGSVVATDISDGMLDVARARANEGGVKNVEFVRMDAENVEFEAESFDAVLCGLGLMYVPDPGCSLREMHRVLRPGGRASVAVWGDRSRCGWAEVFPIVDRRVSSDVCPMFFQLGTGSVLEYVFGQSGFTTVRSERLDVTLRYESGLDACASVFVGGPVALAHNKFDDATKESAYADYLVSIEPYRVDGRYEIPGEYVVACGWKGAGN